VLFVPFGPARKLIFLDKYPWFSLYGVVSNQPSCKCGDCNRLTESLTLQHGACGDRWCSQLIVCIPQVPHHPALGELNPKDLGSVPPNPHPTGYLGSGLTGLASIILARGAFWLWQRFAFFQGRIGIGSAITGTLALNYPSGHHRYVLLFVAFFLVFARYYIGSLSFVHFGFALIVCVICLYSLFYALLRFLCALPTLFLRRNIFRIWSFLGFLSLIPYYYLGHSSDLASMR